MKELEPKFSEIVQEAAQAHFDHPFGLYGEGGSIPFLSELAKIYPET